MLIHGLTLPDTRHLGVRMIDYIHDHIFPAAFAFLPKKMDSTEARTMLLAIGLQESRFEHRKQIGGPARGFWQFEKGGGVVGVFRHRASKLYAVSATRELGYFDTDATVYEAIQHNDVLACVFARLLLWTLPQALPTTQEKAWGQYIEAWRPGKPHYETWGAFYERAEEITKGD